MHPTVSNLVHFSPHTNFMEFLMRVYYINRPYPRGPKEARGPKPEALLRKALPLKANKAKLEAKGKKAIAKVMQKAMARVMIKVIRAMVEKEEKVEEAAEAGAIRPHRARLKCSAFNRRAARPNACSSWRKKAIGRPANKPLKSSNAAPPTAPTSSPWKTCSTTSRATRRSCTRPSWNAWSNSAATLTPRIRSFSTLVTLHAAYRLTFFCFHCRSATRPSTWPPCTPEKIRSKSC